MKKMNVKVRLSLTSQPLVFYNVTNAYQKGDWYCIYMNNVVRKIPIIRIFDVEETYKEPENNAI